MGNNEATTPPPAEDGYTYIHGSALTLESYQAGGEACINDVWYPIVSTVGGAIGFRAGGWWFGQKMMYALKASIRFLTPKPEPKAAEILHQWKDGDATFGLMADLVLMYQRPDGLWVQEVADDCARPMGVAIKQLLAEWEDALTDYRKEVKALSDLGLQYDSLLAEKQALAAKVEELEKERDESKTTSMGLRMAFDCANADAKKAETQRDYWRTEACNRGAQIDGLILERDRLKTDLGHMLRERGNLCKQVGMLAQEVERLRAGATVKEAFPVGCRVRHAWHHRTGTVTVVLSPSVTVSWDAPDEERSVSQTRNLIRIDEPTEAKLPFEVGDRVARKGDSDPMPGTVERVFDGVWVKWDEIQSFALSYRAETLQKLPQPSATDQNQEGEK